MSEAYNLKTEDVMAFFDVSEMTVRKMVKDGKLHPIKLSRSCFRFCQSDIDDFISAKRKEALIEANDRRKST